MKNHSKPILTDIFNILGAVALVIGILLVVHGIKSSEREFVILGAGCILSSVVDFGFAQVVDFLGRTAHYTEEMARMKEQDQLAQMRAQGRTVRNG